MPLVMLYVSSVTSVSSVLIAHSIDVIFDHNISMSDRIFALCKSSFSEDLMIVI